MAHTIRFSRKHSVPPGHDPYRRLLAAVAYTAVTDYLFPKPNLPAYDRSTAKMFCQSPTGQQLLTDLGISPQRIKAVIGEAS